MTDQATEEFLAHFGVKGMKWGVVKDDSSTSTKSVSTETQAKREARAQKFETKAVGYQNSIDTLTNTTYKNALSRRSANSDIQSLQKAKEQALKDADSKRQGKLSSNQKKVIIGAAVVGTIVAATIIYNNADAGNFNRLAAKGKQYISGQRGPSFKKEASLASKMGADDVFEKVVKHINPGYGAPGTKNNCRRATFAYELRRRGMDVQATRSFDGTGQHAGGLLNALTLSSKQSAPTDLQSFNSKLLKEQFQAGKDAALKTPFSDIMKGFGAGAKIGISPDVPGGRVTAQKVFEDLAKQPNGSRGELGVSWIMGGAHSLAYEIFDGKPVVFDTQSGLKMDSVESFSKGAGEVLGSAGLTRLDNVPLNLDYLQKWVKSVK